METGLGILSQRVGCMLIRVSGWTVTVEWCMESQ